MVASRAQVQYAGMSHFEEKYEDFLADTVMLRRRFTPDGGYDWYDSFLPLTGRCFARGCGMASP